MTELRTIEAPAEVKGQRLDLFLAAQLEGVSRSRVQLLLDQGDVLVDGKREKASLKLRGGERIDITGEPRPAPLKAMAEEIPLDVVYEDEELAVINKPAGMMVHADRGRMKKRAIVARWSTRCCTDSRRFRRPAATCAPASCIVSIKTPAG